MLPGNDNQNLPNINHVSAAAARVMFILNFLADKYYSI
jgi:hypothetical protein